MEGEEGVEKDQFTIDELKMGKQVFICNECGKDFPSKTRLNMHSQVHSEQRPYDCNKCEKSFKAKNNMNSHIKRCHEGIKIRPYIRFYSQASKSQGNR